VRAADRILVLRQSVILEEGDHDGLLRRGGHHVELYNTYFRHQALGCMPGGMEIVGGRLSVKGAWGSVPTLLRTQPSFYSPWLLSSTFHCPLCACQLPSRQGQDRGLSFAGDSLGGRRARCNALV